MRGTAVTAIGGRAHILRGTGFTESESEMLRKLPNKEYLVASGSAEEAKLLAGLVDLLYAYIYDHRFTQAEPNAESGWTCCILSPTLCWLDSPETPHAAVVEG